MPYTIGRAPSVPFFVVPLDAGVVERKQRDVLVVAIGSSTLAFLDQSSINIFLPVLQQEFDTGLGAVQWVLEGFVLMLASLLLLGGALGDRFGRRRILRIGLVVFSLASVAAALAPGIWWLNAARVGQGVGAAFIVPASLALITSAFDAKERGRAFGFWAAMTGLTAAGGPLLAGALTDLWSWRLFFWFGVPVAAFVFWYTRRIDETVGNTQHLDIVGGLLAMAALGGITFGLIESNRTTWAHPLVWAPLGLGALLFVAFLVVQAKRAAPLMPLGLFRDRAFAGANAATVGLYGALGATLFFVPFNLIQVQGWSATVAGAATVPAAITITVVSLWTGKWSDRRGPRVPFVSGAFVTAAGYLLLMLPGRDANYWVTFLPAFVVMGAGMAMLIPALTATVMGQVGAAKRGVASGINNTIARAAGLIAIAGFGTLAVAVFSAALPGDVAVEEPQRMAAMPTPDGLDRADVENAFVTAFRTVAGASAALAALSGIIAWATAPRGPEGSDDP